MIGTRMRWFASAGVVAVAAAPMVWIAGNASAATIPVGNVTVVSKASGFSSANKSAKAVCPANTKVVGGGGEVAGSGHVVLIGEVPTAADFTVTAAEDQVGEVGQWQVISYAYCATGNLPGYEIVRKSTSGSGAFQGIASECSGRGQATGAGGLITGGNGQVDLETLGEGADGGFSRRSTAAGLEDRDGFPGNWTVTAFTICVQPSAITDLVMVKKQLSNGQATKTVLAACPSGTRATGSAGWSDTPGHVIVIRPNNITPFQVTVTGRDVTGVVGDWSVIATVFCAR
jgi:hypothetical protein